MKLSKYIAIRLHQAKKNQNMTHDKIAASSKLGFFIVRDVLINRREVKLIEFLALCHTLGLDPVSLIEDFYKKYRERELCGQN